MAEQSTVLGGMCSMDRLRVRVGQLAEFPGISKKIGKCVRSIEASHDKLLL